jgi:hypothetical protein
MRTWQTSVVCVRSLVAAALAALVLVVPAKAQLGDTPGMPGSPGMMAPSGVSPFGAPQSQQGPPPACQKLITYRDETTKHGQALQAAGRKKAPPEEVCKLFKAFLSAEGKMLKGLEENSATCGVPPDVLKQVKTSHAKYSQMGKQVCEMTALGAQPALFGPRREPPGSSGDFWREDELQRLFRQQELFGQ